MSGILRTFDMLICEMRDRKDAFSSRMLASLLPRAGLRRGLIWTSSGTTRPTFFAFNRVPYLWTGDGAVEEGRALEQGAIMFDLA